MKQMKPPENKSVLYCFSPLVMAITIIIEVSLAVYALVRYKHALIRNLAIATFLILATFQFAEFQVCTNTLGNPEMWSRIGYVAITFLPIIGVQAISVLAGRKNRQLLVVLYSIGLVFALYFLITPGVFVASMCTGKLVLFELEKNIGMIYYMFYNIVLFIGLGLAYIYRNKEKSKPKRQALVWYIVGILTFLVPTGIVYVVRPSSIDNLPSIMCGFAVIFALIIGLRILPLVAPKNKIRTKKTK